MSETSSILHDTAHRLFGDAFTRGALDRAAAGEWLGDAWHGIEDMGLPLALVPEEAGGFGLESVEALQLIRLAAYHAAPVPLAETLLGNWLMASAGLATASGPLSLAPVTAGERLALTPDGDGWRLHGRARRVPWGRDAHTVVAIAEHDDRAYVCRLHPGQYGLDREVNLAVEPRDTLDIDTTLAAEAAAPSATTPGHLFALGALARCLAIAGAVERVLETTVDYAGERRQFGRPIGKFQAVQQNLAVLAGHAAAAGAAADTAAEAFSAAPDPLPIAAAKVRAGEAASGAAAIAHQVHGAIGFTEEHSLHFLTRRLWSWRDEFGREAHWAGLVGRRASEAGAGGLWPLIASI